MEQIRQLREQVKALEAQNLHVERPVEALEKHESVIRQPEAEDGRLLIPLWIGEKKIYMISKHTYILSNKMSIYIIYILYLLLSLLGSYCDSLCF